MSTKTPAIKPTFDGIENPDRLTRMARRALIFVFAAWVLDAADSTIYSLTIPAIKGEFGLGLGEIGIIGSIFLAGTVLGSLLLPVLADRKGRKVGMVVCVTGFSVFTGLVGASPNAVFLAVARFFTGSATGAEWPIGAAHLSEVAPPKRRGFIMGIMQAGYPVGYFLAGSVFLVISAMGVSWRWAFLALVIPALVLIPVIRLLKESPTWIATHEQREVEKSIGKKVVMSTYKELFVATYRKNTLIATGIHVCGAIFSYGLVTWIPSAISIDFGMSGVQTAQFVMLSWGCGTFGYLAAGRLSDRFGRKITLSIYVALGLAAVIYLNVLHGRPNVSFGDLVVPGIMIGISLGVSGIYIAYTSEIFPAHLRTIGLGFSVAVGKLTAVVVPAGLGFIAEASSITTSLFVSSAIGILMIPIILLGPETARRRLEDITTD